MLKYLFLLMLFPCIVNAQVTQKDIGVAVRVFNFLVNKPSGMTDVAVLFDPDQDNSIQDRETVWETIDGGTPIGNNITVRSVPVSIHDLDTLNRYRFVILAGGLEKYIQEINKVVKGSGIVTITTNLELVAKGNCSIGIISEPQVQIFVSRSAAKEAAIKFETFFRMMITEM